jgi:Arc/MetJ-type ribon-helix-helix transcriptional regulator
LQIEITKEMQQMIDDILHDLGNRRHSAEGVILIALRELRGCTREKLEALRKEIRLSREQFDRGESISLDEAITRLKDKSEKPRKAPGQ